MDWGALFWLGAMIVFLLAETATVTLISIWFAAGSLAAIVVALLGGGLTLQVGVFLTVALLTLASLRPLVRKHLNPKLIRTNVDSMVGTIGIVTAPVDNIAAQGQVTISGMEWMARSTDGTPIPLGKQVRVDRIEGVKAFVSLAGEPVAK